MAEINGTAGDDILNGTSGNDTIYGLAGNDTLDGEVALQSQVLDGIPGWEDWLALIQRPSLEERERREFRTAVANFLSDNPDLAGDEGKIFMVHYCYNNYVKINPAFSGMPYQERLAKAGEITRSFLDSPVF